MAKRARRAYRSVWERRGPRWLAGFGAAAAVVVVVGVAGASRVAAGPPPPCIPMPPTNTASPTISPTGWQAVGTVLTSTHGSWTESCGSYTTNPQWYRGTSVISGATAWSYTTQNADVGYTVTAKVTACDPILDCTTQPATGSVTPGTAPVNTVAPPISGTPQVGQTLTASVGTWTGYPTPTYTYQWKYSTSRAGAYTNVSSSGTSQTYVVASGYANDFFEVAVTGTNALNSATATSAATGQPPTTGSVAITGTAQAAQTLTATASGFGLGTPTGQYVYRWYRCQNATDTPGLGTCATVDRTSSSTSSTTDAYTAIANDLNYYIKVVATVTNTCSAGCTPPASATSSATSVVAGVAPTAGSVAISGIAKSDQTLTATASGFALGTPTGQYVYTWYRCTNAADTPGQGTCTTVDRTSSLTSSTTDTYTTVAADIGYYVGVVAAASNSCSSGCGSVTATSSSGGAHVGPTGDVGPTGADGPSGGVGPTGATGSTDDVPCPYGNGCKPNLKGKWLLRYGTDVGGALLQGTRASITMEVGQAPQSDSCLLYDSVAYRANQYEQIEAGLAWCGSNSQGLDHGQAVACPYPLSVFKYSETIHNNVQICHFDSFASAGTPHDFELKETSPTSDNWTAKIDSGTPTLPFNLVTNNVRIGGWGEYSPPTNRTRTDACVDLWTGSGRFDNWARFHYYGSSGGGWYTVGKAAKSATPCIGGGNTWQVSGLHPANIGTGSATNYFTVTR